MEYWNWLIKKGVRRFLDRWIIVHVVASALLTTLVPVALKDAANTVLLPLAGVFIGLCFAWGGNAQALLQTDELEDLSEHHPGGIEEYAFVYQTAILVVMTTLVLWGFAGLNIFDGTWPRMPGLAYDFVSGCLFFMSSVALRECWHVVLGAHSMLITRAGIRRDKKRSPSAHPNGCVPPPSP
jgi:hypothetical protein